MFLEGFKEIQNFTITKLSLGGNKTNFWPSITRRNKENQASPVIIDRVEAAIQAYTHTHRLAHNTHTHTRTRTHTQIHTDECMHARTHTSIHTFSKIMWYKLLTFIFMFLERFKEVENFIITKLSLGGSKTDFWPAFTQKNKENVTCPVKIYRVEAAIQAYTHTPTTPTQTRGHAHNLHTHKHAHAYTPTQTHAGTHTRTHKHTHSHAHTRTHAYTHIHTDIF